MSSPSRREELARGLTVQLSEGDPFFRFQVMLAGSKKDAGHSHPRRPGPRLADRATLARRDYGFLNWIAITTNAKYYWTKYLAKTVRKMRNNAAVVSISGEEVVHAHYILSKAWS